MPNPSSIEAKNAFNTLKLDVNSKPKKEDIDKAYKERAKKCHPDKGGTHQQFLDLRNAYGVALNCLENQTKKKVNRGLPVTEALAKLHTVICTVSENLSKYENQHALPLQQLRKHFEEIQCVLREDILDDSPEAACNILRNAANNLSFHIDNIWKGPTPASVAMVVFAVMTVLLGIAALMIALSSGVVLGTATLSGLITLPPATGFFFGVYGFFSVKSAHKNRLAQQQEMKKIVAAVNELADVITIASKTDFTRADVTVGVNTDPEENLMRPLLF